MLESFQEKNRAAFIPYLVVGDPDLGVSREMAEILIEEGADALELGVPFSDALADGPVIQNASERASKTTDSISQVLKFARHLRQDHPNLPLILFTYLNPVFKVGFDRFAVQARESGITAVLVVDLPPEEAASYLKALESQSLQSVFLASPTTSPERLKIISRASSGFIYYVSRTGVTGVQSSLSETLAEELGRLRDLTGKPIAVGFGISNAEQAAEVASQADAVVVGSAFVRLISNQDPRQRKEQVRRLARSMKQAITAVSPK